MNKNLLTTLAFSMHANKGVYALFLGSGVSFSTGIPTGWHIAQDLTSQLAIINGVSDVVDSVEWYRKQYSKEADYSDLLGKLVTTSTERIGLMKPYFIPNDDKMEEGLKQPTVAHRAVAKFIRDGYVKVVVTTNFDRLLEKALAEVNVVPQVIRTEADIEGATPLVHANCTIIKINGDFMDCRFKNTIEELADYSETWKSYLARVFEDFGLITCGWSAKWDKALVELIKAKLSQRYNSTFTGIEGADNDALKSLATFKHSTMLEIDDADSFFQILAENTEVLEYVNRNTTLSADLAVARVKKYISLPQYTIQLSDLFEDEVKNVIATLQTKKSSNDTPSRQLMQDMTAIAVNASKVYLPMLECAIRWCRAEHEEVIVDSLEGILNRDVKDPQSGSYYEASCSLNYLGAAMLFFAAGILCIRYKKYSLLNSILSLEFSGVKELCRRVWDGPVVENLNCWLIDRLFDLSSSMFPLNSTVFYQLQTLIPSKKFDSEFYIFEKMLCLYNAMLAKYNKEGKEARDLPSGLYMLQYTDNLKDVYNSLMI